MYETDTFWHLSPVGRVGLVVISGTLAALTLWACHALCRHRRWVTRVLVALGVVAVFEWLAPQVHYLWYIVVIDGLPLHWVAGPLPRSASVWEVLSFQEPPSLSSHGRGAFGWLVLTTALAAPWIELWLGRWLGRQFRRRP